MLVSFSYVKMRVDPRRNRKLNPNDYIGRAGGIARAKKLSAARRKEIAKQGAAKRWKDKKD